MRREAPGKKEIYMRIVIIAIIMIFLLAAPAWTENDCQKGAKMVSRGLQEVPQKAGQRFKDLGRDIKKSSREGAENIKKSSQEAGKDAGKTGRSIGEWFKDTGKKTGDAFREFGRIIRKFFTGR